MARRSSQPPSPPPAKLLVPVNEARDRLVSRRELGLSLLDSQRASIGSVEGLEEGRAVYKKWDDFNRELLRRIFDTEEYSEAYDRIGYYSFGISSIGGGRDVRGEIREHLELIDSKINYIDSLADRLDLISIAPSAQVRAVSSLRLESKAEKSKTRVFIVHGQDSETKTVVARFIEHCGLEPIILHEQTDQGRTIIEKFEQISDVSFAVVLLTPDDIGGLRPETGGALENARPRARQNVILELGYFIGKLGRGGVCALKKGDVELPSDFSGVVYTPYDGADEGWKIKLAREMRAAGLDVDLNRALA